VVPMPMPAAPRRYLIEVVRELPVAVACHRPLVVVPWQLPEKPFHVRRCYLAMVAEAVARGAFAVLRTYLAVVPRPVPRPLLAATRSCRSRRKTLGR